MNQGKPRVSTSMDNVDKKVLGGTSPSSKMKMNLSVKIPEQHIPQVVQPTDVPSPRKRCPIQVGKLYELDDERIGQCMFIGPTQFHKIGIWVGLQLENAEGKHNGTVKGRRYFLCRQGKGIFVRPQRVRKLVTEVSKSQVNPQDKKVVKDPSRNRYLRKESIGDLVEMTTPTYSKRGWLEFERKNSYRNLNAQVITDDSGWTPAQYDIKTDYGAINKPLMSYPDKVLNAHLHEKAKHKPGPIETGRIAYNAAEFKMYGSKIPETQYDCYHPVSDLHKRDNVKTPRKIGAIETGWNTDFQGAKFAEDEATLEKQFSIDKNQYLLSYPKSKLHKHDGEHAEHKPGPIETGTIDYKAADYNTDISITDTQYNCYHPVGHLHKRDHVKTPRKIGAIETGWNVDFQGAKFAKDEATLEKQFSIDKNQYLLAYPKKDLHKHDGEHAEHKPGAIETGTNDYKAANYKIDNSITATQYACYHPVSELHKTDSVKTPRKIGAIETGWNDAFNEYNPNESKKNRVKMSSQRYNTEDSISSSTENKKDRMHRGGELKKLKQHVTDEEIDAYLPRRFSSTRNSIDKGTVTKGISRNDFSDGSSSDEAEQDNFSKDILSFARKGLEKRHNLKITVPK